MGYGVVLCGYENRPTIEPSGKEHESVDARFGNEPIEIIRRGECVQFPVPISVAAVAEILELTPAEDEELYAHSVFG